MQVPSIDVPFGPFMLGQTEVAQQLFVRMAEQSRPPIHEMDYLNPFVTQLLSRTDKKRFTRMRFEGDVATKTWSIAVMPT